MTNLRRILWSIVVIAFAQAAARSPAPSKETEPCTAEDYAIYAAALTDLFGNQKHDKVLLINQTSRDVPPGLAKISVYGGNKVQGFLKDVPKEAKDEFDSHNKFYAYAKIEEGKISDTVLLSAEDARKLVEGGLGWEEFHTSFPMAHGITVVSRPGMNSERNRALLYVGTSCERLCGKGVFIFLGKDGKQWKLLNQVTMWSSPPVPGGGTGGV